MNIPHRKILLLSLLIFMVSASACHDDGAKPLAIAGNWSVTKAICDDVEQSAWVGKTISFKQFSADSGVYEFPNTVYDSIWSKSGGWKTTSPDDLVRYDFYPAIPCRYIVSNNALSMTFLLPTAPSTPTEFPVILKLGGNWSFTFQRK